MAEYDNIGFMRPDCLLIEPLAESIRDYSFLTVLDAIVIICKQLSRLPEEDTLAPPGMWGRLASKLETISDEEKNITVEWEKQDEE